MRDHCKRFKITKIKFKNKLKTSRTGKDEKLAQGWWEHKTVKLLWKAICQVLTKLNIRLLYNQAVSLFAIYPREMRHYVHTHKHMFIANSS